MGSTTTFRAVLTGAVLRDLLRRSRWYRLAFAAALLGAVLDGWLSPAVIPHHPGTGELNAVSAYHVLDGLTFATVRVLAVLVLGLLVALAVARDGSGPWSHAAMGLIALANYVNGTIALSSGMAAASGASIDLGHLLGGSFAAAALACAVVVLFVSRPRLRSPPDAPAASIANRSNVGSGFGSSDRARTESSGDRRSGR